MCRRFGGGPVGLTTLAVTVGEEAETVETVAEPAPWQDATRITFTSEAAEQTLHTTAPDGSTTRRQVSRARGMAALTVSPQRVGLRWHDSAFHLTMVPAAPDAPKEGFDIIPMWIADMNFPTVPAIPEAMIERALAAC